MNKRELFKELLGQTSDFPLMLEFESAKGIYMYDPEGNPSVDLISGIGVSCLGHSHPKVVSAIHEQVDKYHHLMVYGEFVQTPQVAFAEALAKTLPSHLNCSFLVNSGSEAVEGALKLAKRFTGRTGLVSCRAAYHGSTHGALSVCGEDSLRENFGEFLPHVKHIVFNDIDSLSEITNETAAFIVETIQGEAGVRLPTKDYLNAIRARCTETGTLLILDEIQCGAGRSGSFWAFEQYGITPDILVTAKGIGGGMPIGAFISSKEIMSVLRNDPILGHITTFGGHPVSSASAAAAVNELLDSGLIEQVESKGALLESLLTAHPKVLGIRRIGLMIAIQFASFEENKWVIDELIKEGVVSDWFLFCDDSMRIAPPLIITEEEIKAVCAKIITVLDRI